MKKNLYRTGLAAIAASLVFNASPAGAQFLDKLTGGLTGGESSSDTQQEAMDLDQIIDETLTALQDSRDVERKGRTLLAIANSAMADAEVLVVQGNIARGALSTTIDALLSGSTQVADATPEMFNRLKSVEVSAKSAQGTFKKIENAELENLKKESDDIDKKDKNSTDENTEEEDNNIAEYSSTIDLTNKNVAIEAYKKSSAEVNKAAKLFEGKIAEAQLTFNKDQANWQAEFSAFFNDLIIPATRNISASYGTMQGMIGHFDGIETKLDQIDQQAEVTKGALVEEGLRRVAVLAVQSTKLSSAISQLRDSISPMSMTPARISELKGQVESLVSLLEVVTDYIDTIKSYNQNIARVNSVLASFSNGLNVTRTTVTEATEHAEILLAALNQAITTALN